MTSTFTTGVDSSAVIGIIGNRHLVALQTIDIARLTTHPVPLVPGTFIAVSGQGPKGDSNGSGKTSFLAAISLLLGDAQWRLEANGSQDAPKLLFSLPSAGLDRDSGYSSADCGYVIGVFAEKENFVETSLTVWVRIKSTPPYLRVRWTHGLHVAEGETDSERYEQAAAMWEALPKDHEIGPKHLRTKLYGTAPKGIAYVDTSMRKSAPSLLSQQMTEMTPEQIGVALIELTGRQGLLETEEEQRARLATHQADLAAQQEQDRENRRREGVELEGVRHRERSRERLSEGERLWRLHFARGYLDVLDADTRLQSIIAELDDDLAEARRSAEGARQELAGLRARTDLVKAEAAANAAYEAATEHLREAEQRQWGKTEEARRLNEERAQQQRVAAEGSGLSVPEAEERVEAARVAHGEAHFALRQANHARGNAEGELADAQQGAGGDSAPALARLREAGVDARLLLDEITLSAQARPLWEPRLWPHRHALVVSRGDRDAALDTVADLPGTVIVVADGPLDRPPTALPTGVSTSVPVAAFLTTLADRTVAAQNPDRVIDAALNEQVLGGFTAEIAGRAARIATAQERLDRAVEAFELADRNQQNTQAALEMADEDLVAAQAAARVEEIEARLGILRGEITAVDGEVKARTRAERQARDASVEASANARSHHEQVRLAEQGVRTAEQEAARLNLLHREKDQERGNLRVGYWQSGWGDSPEAAEALLREQPETLGSTQQGSLRRRSAEALKDALDAYTDTLTEVPPMLQDAIRRRQALADGEPGVGRDTVSFDSVAQPLRDLLNARSESDHILEARIQAEQHARETRISEVAAEVDRKHAEWDRVQDMVSARIEAALSKISTSLDRLNRVRGGFGAELKIKETRPTTPTSTWKWEVTPRWRRSSTGGMVNYREVANGAQVKVFAIQLVLAALLADEGAQGRVLVIDELGNSLGDVHRKDVLKDLNEVAREQDVTILGTCQDSVIGDAAGVCGEILWFSHAHEADAYNQPTRMWAYDEDSERVRLTMDWLTAGRTLV
jgi:hypothetical protein